MPSALSQLIFSGLRVPRAWPSRALVPSAMDDLHSHQSDQVTADQTCNKQILTNGTISGEGFNLEDKLMPLLDRLSSHSLQQRIASIQSLECLLEPKKGDKCYRLLRLCRQILDIQIDPFNYREIVRYLTDVTAAAKDAQDESVCKIAYHFLLGTLYLNFTLIWPPVREAIASAFKENHAHRTLFVKSLMRKLQLQSATDEPVEEEKENAKERVDLNSYRLNVLLILESCNPLTEQYNRLFVPYFFQLHDSLTALKDGVNGDDDTSHVKIQAATWSLLEGYLKVLATFTNAKSIHRSEDLERVFHSLLKSPRPIVQEYAVKCIFNYGNSQLTPYKNHLLQIIDEKTFKTALISFNINAANDEDRILPDKDRPVVMPILLSILTGKLKYKTPQRKVKSASQAKKPIILRFIGACKVEEIMSFLGKILQPLTALIEAPIDEAVKRVEKSFDSVKFHTLESALKTLKLCFEYFGNVSLILTSYLSRALLIIAAYVKNKLDCEEEKKAKLEESGRKEEEKNEEEKEAENAHDDEVKVELAKVSHSIYRYREIRSSCIKLSITLFKELRDQVLPPREINSLFTLLIEPALKCIKPQDFATVPQILSLLLVFSEDSRLFPLLDYRITQESLSPFDVLVRSLKDAKENSPGCDVILTIISNILTLDEIGTDDLSGPPGEKPICFLSLSVACKTAGIDLVKPHASTILSCYKRLLTGITSIAARRGRKKSLGKVKVNIKPRDLQTLKHFGTLVSSEDDCYTLASLLIEILSVTYTKDSHHTEYFIEAISKLTEVCLTRSKSLLPLLAPLFYSIRENRFRSQLAQCVSRITDHIPESNLTSSSITGGNVAPLVNGLVSIHKVAPGTLIDEADYGAKFQGFKQIAQHLPHVTMSDVSLNLLQMIANSTCHTLLYTSDPGVTRSALELIEEMAKEFSCSLVTTRVPMRETDEGEEGKEGPPKAKTTSTLPTGVPSFGGDDGDEDEDENEDTTGVPVAVAVTGATSPGGQVNVNVPVNSFYYKICINVFLMRGVKQGIRHKDDMVRALFIELLEILLKYDKSLHPVLHDLSTLSNEKDIEVDFWYNVKHIQRHRRARAFLRLAHKPSLLASMRREVLWNFLLPLVEPNVKKEQKHLATSSSSSSSSPGSLEKASIELIGVLSRFFTWKQYKTCLRKYLANFTDGSLTVSVDVVSRILTNFPFDLTNAVYEKSNLKLIHEKKGKKKQGQKTVQLETPRLMSSSTNVDISSTVAAAGGTTEATSTTATTTSVVAATGTTAPTVKTCIRNKTSQVSTGLQGHTVIEKQRVSPEQATAIFNEVKGIIVYEICCKIFEMSYIDHDADRMKNTFDEIEQVQRIPLAIAVVKLLIQFPPESGLLDTHLNGILLRLLQFLKSKSEKIRKVARKALQTITLDLGPRYLAFILTELKNSLTKGFQRHILSFTVHFLLSSLKEKAKVTSGSFDSVMALLFDICVDDLLGGASEEKEVAKIISKTMEARKPKANEIFYLMGFFCGPRVLVALLKKFTQLLATASTYRVLRKISHSIDNWMSGLTANDGLSVECLLQFSHNIMKESSGDFKNISASENEQKLGNDEEQCEHGEVGKANREKNQLRRKIDSLVIDPASVNNRKASKQHAYNQHTVLLIEKATSLLLTLLESKKVQGNSLLPLVDPFVPFLTEYLSYKHVKLLSSTLRLLLILGKKFAFLPSLEEKSSVIKNRVFVLMSQHSGFKSNEGSTEQLTDLCFKTMANLLARKEVDLTTDQLAVLLSHIDQDLDDGAGKPASFALLKSIATRLAGKEVPEMENLMKKVSHMAIQCEDENIRKRCVATWITYLQSYLRGKILQEHLLFIVRQLEYKREPGRLSALTVLAAAVRALPVSSLKTNQPVLLVPLACRLINEDSSKCKELAFRVIKELLRNLGQEERDNIFTSLVLPCLKHNAISQRSLATLLATLYFQIEKEYFNQNRWSIVSPVLARQLSEVAQEEKSRKRKHKQLQVHKRENAVGQDADEEEGEKKQRQMEIEGEEEEGEDQVSEEEEVKDGKEEKEQVEEEDEKEEEKKRRELGLLLFQQLSLVLEVMKVGAKKNAKWVRSEPGLQSILGAVEECYLRFPHSWVRLISARVLGHLFSLYAPQELAEALKLREAAHDEFLLREPEKRLPLLTRGFVLLFYSCSSSNFNFTPQTKAQSEALAEAGADLQPLGKRLVKNLAFVARVLVLTARLAPPPSSLCPKLTMSWFLKQILEPALRERARNAHCIRIRLLVLKLMALIIVELEQKELLSVLPLFLPTLAREVDDPNNQTSEREQLYLQAQQVFQMTRFIAGGNNFDSIWTSVQAGLREKKLTRKQMQAQNVSYLLLTLAHPLRKVKHLLKLLFLFSFSHFFLAHYCTG